MNFCMRELACLTLKVEVLQGEKNLTPNRSPVLSHVCLSVQIRPKNAEKGPQGGQTAGYSDNAMS